MRTLLEYERDGHKEMALLHSKEDLDAHLTSMVAVEHVAGRLLYYNFKAYSVGSELAAGSVMLGIKRVEMARSTNVVG